MPAVPNRWGTGRTRQARGWSCVASRRPRPTRSLTPHPTSRARHRRRFRLCGSYEVFSSTRSIPLPADRVRPARGRRRGDSARDQRPERRTRGQTRRQGDAVMTGEEVLAPVSETETLRQQLLQAQRLSSVGELASSIAHEFNNILTTIINSAKLGMRNQESAEKQLAFERIVKAGQRAAT